MSKVKDLKYNIEGMLIILYRNIGIDRPENHNEILDFITNDVMETADPIYWHSGDVAIGFRRWMESKQEQCTNSTQPISNNPTFGTRINTIGELRLALSEQAADDNVCIETIDLETGDAADIYPMYVDVIDKDVRFCLLSNGELETRDKQPLIDAVIEQLKQDAADGDESVIDSLLKTIPWNVLKYSLPEDKWGMFDSKEYL